MVNRKSEESDWISSDLRFTINDLRRYDLTNRNHIEQFGLEVYRDRAVLEERPIQPLEIIGVITKDGDLVV
jgi:hypothetical protein